VSTLSQQNKGGKRIPKKKLTEPMTKSAMSAVSSEIKEKKQVSAGGRGPEETEKKGHYKVNYMMKKGTALNKQKTRPKKISQKVDRPNANRITDGHPKNMNGRETGLPR